MLNTHKRGARKGTPHQGPGRPERTIEVTRAQSGRLNTHKHGARAATVLDANLKRVRLATKSVA